MYQRAREIFEKTLDPEHPRMAAILNNLGETYWALGRFDEAVEWGIANRVYAADVFDGAVRRIARDLADGPTHLQAIAKESFHSGWRRSVEEATEYEIQNVMKSVRHPYFRQALDQFLAGERKSDVEQVRLP